MRRTPVVLAAVGAVLAVVLPLAAPVLTTPPGPVPPALRSAVPLLAVLLAAAVVLVAGRAGHRAAARALRGGGLTADVLTSAGTLAALSWSAPVAVSVAVSPAGPGAVPDVPLTGGALLPGVAAVLTVVSTAVRRAEGPSGDGAGLWVAADRWCRRLGPVALLVAAAVGGFRTGIGQPAAVAVPAGLAVLLAACPCALLAAVPAAVHAARRVGGAAVRLPLPVPAGRAADDRAGAGWWDPVGWTAPDGGPAVVDRVDAVALAGPDVLTGAGAAPLAVHPAEGTDPDLVLRLATSVARAAVAGSDLGPVARALRAATRRSGVAPPDVAEPDERSGLGVSGLVAELVPARAPDRLPSRAGAGAATGTRTGSRAGAGTVVAHAVLLGSPAWLREHGVGLPPEVSRARERAEAEGRAVVAVAWDGTARAVLALPRSPHPTAVPGIDALRAAGTEPVLLTPDDAAAARALGQASGLDPSDPDAIRSGLDAVGRAAAVAGLQVRGRTVAVAADPRCDPAALAGADLAIALTPPDTTDAHDRTAADDSAAPAAPGALAPPTGCPEGHPRPPAGPEGAPGAGTGGFGGTGGLAETGGGAGTGGVAEAGAGVFAVRGGPGEVADALVLARRARRAAAAGLHTGLVPAGIGIVLAAAGLPAAPAAAVPVAATAAVLAVVHRRVRHPAGREDRPTG